MKPKDATFKFKLADESYRAGRFAEALSLLEEIDRGFPGNRNVMFPRARCLAKLDRTDEALVLCNLLSELYDHGKAREFKARIMGTGAAGEDNGAFETLQLGQDFADTPVILNATRRDGAWTTVAVVTLIVASVILAGYVVLFRS